VHPPTETDSHSSICHAERTTLVRAE
jgi:hypothetical protein